MDDGLLFRSLTRRATEAEDALVQEWCRVSPDNEIRYLELARILDLASCADQQHKERAIPSVEDVLARAEALCRGRKPTELTRAHRTARRLPRFWLRYVAAAAAVALLAVAVGLWQERSTRLLTTGLRIHEVVTGSSESVTISLADGSVVRLGPGSRLRISMQAPWDGFLEGQAYFAVAKQHEGPLRIRTPAGDVRVLGTRFGLETHGSELRLLVIEGLVILSIRGTETPVSARELILVTEGVPMPVIERLPEIDSLPAELLPDWLGSFVAFQETPLRDIARELGQQFGVKVEIADSDMESETFTGWFFGWRLEEILEVICDATNAECSVADSIAMVRRKR